MTILLISCSNTKREGRGPASEIYAGPLLTLGIQYAYIQKWKPLILSGRYGIISPDRVIDCYDHRLVEPYKGPWPEESGYWLGSSVYFKEAPPHIVRLMDEGMSYGMQKSFLNKVVNPHKYGL
jgi:hypothetical protein